MKSFQKWIIAGIILLPVLLGCIMLTFNGGNRPAGCAGSSFKRIGLVIIKGTIYESEEYVRQLQSMRLDNSIAGVIVRIDSPGGAVAPSQEIYAEMMKFRLARKPLAVSMGTVAASGGYYIARALLQRSLPTPEPLPAVSASFSRCRFFRSSRKKSASSFASLPQVN